MRPAVMSDALASRSNEGHSRTGHPPDPGGDLSGSLVGVGGVGNTHRPKQLRRRLPAGRVRGVTGLIQVGRADARVGGGTARIRESAQDPIIRLA